MPHHPPLTAEVMQHALRMSLAHFTPVQTWLLALANADALRYGPGSRSPASLSLQALQSGMRELHQILQAPGWDQAMTRPRAPCRSRVTRKELRRLQQVYRPDRWPENPLADLITKAMNDLREELRTTPR